MAQDDPLECRPMLLTDATLFREEAERARRCAAAMTEKKRPCRNLTAEIGPPSLQMRFSTASVVSRHSAVI
jgi:hypothetical protein